MSASSTNRCSGSMPLVALPTSHRTLGTLCEGIAQKYLVNHRYSFIAKNWRCPSGELDLIFLDESTDNTVVIIEVKARERTSAHSTKHSVDFKKQQQLYRVAEIFCRTYNGENHTDKTKIYPSTHFRIDTIRIAYWYTPGTFSFNLEHTKNALHHGFTFQKKKLGSIANCTICERRIPEK